MAATWSTEQVLALSPDANSTKNGQKLATPTKWATLGKTGAFVWGACQGSGKKPYQAQIHLDGPAFRCSCPSRKFPCKHALGLFLLLAQQADLFTTTEPPTWVAEWMEKRQKSAPAPPQASTKLVDPAAQAKRVQKREAKIQAGLDELDRWLQDLMRQGLAAAQTQPYRFWDDIAARMVDAQAPGLARRLRSLAGIPHSGPGWVDRLLAELGKLHLLIQGYRKAETLAAGMRAEVRSQIGWNQSQDELLALAEQQDTAVTQIRDRWTVLGTRMLKEEQLRVQRLWLWGETCNRPALFLSFAYGKQPLEIPLVPGVVVDAELVFFSGAYLLRVLIKQLHGTPQLPTALPGIYSVADAIAVYAQALQQNPWLERIPLVLDAVVPELVGDRWRLRDLNHDWLPLDPKNGWDWELLALSGGHPITVAGEWDGFAFYPLSVWADGRMVLF
ncbi:MAG: SWIM zinc finger family protein [Cyanobacteria bacterium J06639_16]